MNWIFLINFAIALAIALLLGLNFFRYYKNRKIRETVNYLLFIGILYFFAAVFSFLWYLDILKYNSNDFLFLYALVILCQSVFFVMIIFSIFHYNKMFFFLFFYAVILISFFFPVFNFFYLFIITSFLLTLLFFIDLSIESFHCRKTGYFGIFYSSLSLLFCMLLLFRIGDIFILSSISNLLFLGLIVGFSRELKYLHLECRKNKEKKRESPFFLVFLRYLVFILVITNFVFIATIVIHEFGHLAVSHFYGCGEGQIVYGKDIHTEILCSEIPDNSPVILGGFLLPFIIAVFLFIIGGRFIKDIALLIAGFDLIASNKDFFDIGLSGNIVMAALIAGVLCLIAGIFMLIKSRLGGQYFAP